MAEEPCKQCEEHAELHKGNWLGLGSQNEPCKECEEHVELHKRERSWSWW